MGPLEGIYYLGYSLRKSLDLRNERRLPKRVISVGNITVGGTGKTPAVIAIAQKAQEDGFGPCILTRGYGGKAKGPCFISKGDGALIGIKEAGDEPILLAETLKGVPVVKGKERFAAGMFALRHLEPQPQLFILDDGFQHRKLYRDMNILLIDGTDPFGNRKLLPSGRLREPLYEMKRADVIVITRTSRVLSGVSCFSPPCLPPISPKESSSAGDSIWRLINEIRAFNQSAPVFLSDHRPTSLRTLSGSAFQSHLLSGKRVFGFCGIGNPGSFRDTLLGITAEVTEIAVFRDHVMYTASDARMIARDARKCRAEWIVTTEKDIMKFREIALPDGMAGRLVSLGIEFVAANDFYETVLQGGLDDQVRKRKKPDTK